MANNGNHAHAAGEHLGLARDHLTVGAADAVEEGVAAAKEAGAVLDEKLEGLLDQGKELLGQAEEMIRTRPWTAFGAAFAAGYVIAKLSRRS